MDVISIIMLIAMIIGLIFYIAQCIKESKQQAEFYQLISSIEKREREKIYAELNKQLDKILKEIKKNENKN